MRVKKCSYNREFDYDMVNVFLKETYEFGFFNNWLQPRWEYMHFHPYTDTNDFHKIALWKSDDEIVAMANYEHRPGIAYFAFRKGYEFLKEAMLGHAMENLCSTNDEGRKYLVIFLNEFDGEFIKLAKENGFERVESYSECNSLYDTENGIPEITVPGGYEIVSLEDENDLYKVDRVLWRGFNHTGEPPADGITGRKLMQSAPNFRKDLNIAIRNESGDFVSYSGIWLDHENGYGYIEPVATDPDYRKKSLGKAAVLECIQRAYEEGIEKIYVGSSQDFYLKIGFEKIFDFPQFIKYFD